MTNSNPPPRRPPVPFWVVVSTLFISVYLFLGFQLLTALSWPLLALTLIWTGLALPFALILWLPLVYWRHDEPELSPRNERMLWGSYFSMGFLSFILFFCVLREALILTARAYGFFSGFISSAGFIAGITGAISGFAGGAARLPIWMMDARGSAVILLCALGAMIIGFNQARGTPTIKTVDVPIKGLPAKLAGFRIVQISDLHVGSTIHRPFVELVVKTANRLEADIITLTGDLIDGTVKQLESHFAPLRELKSRLGHFYVTGNHEYYWEADAWIQHIRDCGITPLLNSHRILEKDGAKIVVAGVVDLWAAKSQPGAPDADPKAALAGAPADAAVRILLAHQPKLALTAAPLGYDLQLSGHTHGGQFLPWTLAIHWFQPFVQGLHRVGKMWLYVNRGTGYWGPPVRLGSASEITLIRLVTL